MTHSSGGSDGKGMQTGSLTAAATSASASASAVRSSLALSQTLLHRLQTFDYLLRSHSGTVHWMNVCKLSAQTMSRYHPQAKLAKRIARWSILGLSFGRLIQQQNNAAANKDKPLQQQQQNKQSTRQSPEAQLRSLHQSNNLLLSPQSHRLNAPLGAHTAASPAAAASSPPHPTGPGIGIGEFTSNLTTVQLIRSCLQIMEEYEHSLTERPYASSGGGTSTGASMHHHHSLKHTLTGTSSSHSHKESNHPHALQQLDSGLNLHWCKYYSQHFVPPNVNHASTLNPHNAQILSAAAQATGSAAAAVSQPPEPAPVSSNQSTSSNRSESHLTDSLRPHLLRHRQSRAVTYSHFCSSTLSSSALAQLDYCDVVVSLLSCLHALYTVVLTQHYTPCSESDAIRHALLKFDKAVQKHIIDKLCVDVQNCALTLLNVEVAQLLNHAFIDASEQHQPPVVVMPSAPKHSRKLSLGGRQNQVHPLTLPSNAQPHHSPNASSFMSSPQQAPTSAAGSPPAVPSYYKLESGAEVDWQEQSHLHAHNVPQQSATVFSNNTGSQAIKSATPVFSPFPSFDGRPDPDTPHSDSDSSDQGGRLLAQSRPS